MAAPPLVDARAEEVPAKPARLPATPPGSSMASRNRPHQRLLLLTNGWHSASAFRWVCPARWHWQASCTPSGGGTCAGRPRHSGSDRSGKTFWLSRGERRYEGRYEERDGWCYMHVWRLASIWFSLRLRHLFYLAFYVVFWDFGFVFDILFGWLDMGIIAVDSCGITPNIDFDSHISILLARSCHSPAALDTSPMLQTRHFWKYETEEASKGLTLGAYPPYEACATRCSCHFPFVFHSRYAFPISHITNNLQGSPSACLWNASATCRSR